MTEIVDDWLTKGNLPHWCKPGYAHFITYRLANSIPQNLLQEWRGRRLSQTSETENSVEQRSRSERAHKLFFKSFDQHLDLCGGVRWLERTDIAKLVRENLYHHHGSLYQLLSWCVMPNHVHILIQPLEKKQADLLSFGDELSDSKSPLSRIMHSLKSYTANAANQLLGRTGSFWQSESYDHWVRDIAELERIHRYIQMNPVQAGLCDQPEHWRFSSSFDRFTIDGSTCGYVGKMTDDWKGG